MLEQIKKGTIKNKNWLDVLQKVNAIYNFIIGGRNGRKSTKIQLKLLNDYFEKKRGFILIRRKTDETISENWFTPYVQEQLKLDKKQILYKKSITKGERYTGYFFIADENGENAELFGKVMFLSMEQKYKSNEAEYFEMFYNVVFEEFIANTDKDYLTNEPQRLVNLISTVFRSRPCSIYLIGNTLDGQQTNPYFRFFELDDLELTVNEYYIFKNEFNIKISLFYVANCLTQGIPEYQQIKNNLVGTTGEWAEDRTLLKINLNTLTADIEIIPLILLYRNTKYYIYKIKEREYEQEYIYITPQLYYKNGVTSLEEFRKTLPKQHKDYSIKLLNHLYPDRFTYSMTNHRFEFIPDTPKIKFTIFNIDRSELLKEAIKNDNARKLELLNQYLYGFTAFCSSKSLIFWLKTERKEYLKNLIW